MSDSIAPASDQERRRLTLDAPKKPCAECPWRLDVDTNAFDMDRFVALAHTAYDMDRHVFTCHKSSLDHPVVCAGFLSRGADHNLTIRLAYAFGELLKTDRSGNMALYDSYRAMAIANGVDPEDPALAPCRGPAE